jgi:flagellar hook protein FlgE
MSLLSALYTGVSGLQSFGESLQVIGDNISNVNTTGFKSSRAEFADMLSQSLEGGSSRGQIGRGVTMEGVTKSFAQGSLSNTDRLTDLAVNGNGFFIVNNGTQSYYTRNGALALNANGQLVTSNGYTLMGYQYDTAGLVRSNQLAALTVGSNATQPNATGDGSQAGSGVQLRLNLNSQTAINATAFDVANPAATADFSTSITAYDSIGQSHAMQVYFKKTADNSWAWHALVDGSDVTGGTAGTPVEGGTGTLTFTASGAFQSVAGTTATFNFKGTDQTIGLNFGTTIADGASGLDGTTQFANPNVVNSQSQDGFASGTLSSLSIDQNGTISGIYTNGRTIPIGQISLATFQNLQGLYNAGSGLYSETSDSGMPLIGDPNSGVLGSISSYSLELSNVDLATEFVNLISMQRAYQANTKIITTGDQLLSDIINIIR